MKDTVKAGNAKSAVIIDLNSTYHTCKSVYKGRPNYSVIIKALSVFNPAGRTFGVDTGREYHFRRYLQSLGYQAHFRLPKIYEDNRKSATVDVMIAVEAMRLLHDVDGIVLLSSDHNLNYVLKAYNALNKFTCVVGINIARELKECCTRYAEITEDAITKATDPVVLFSDQLSNTVEEVR